jgi:hypothetical protein
LEKNRVGVIAGLAPKTGGIKFTCAFKYYAPLPKGAPDGSMKLKLPF